MQIRQPHQHYFPKSRERSRLTRWIAFVIMCLILSPLFTGCLMGAGSDAVAEEDDSQYVPSGCAAYPRPPACI
jgi:nitrate reductase NapE component